MFSTFLFQESSDKSAPNMHYLSSILPLILVACGVQPHKLDVALPSLLKQLDCLPPETAMISAHRGTSKNSSEAENSLEGLKSLMKKGYLMAEIDIARLKDNTHILFHDGVWEEGSTGRGVVAATTWTDASKFLLKDSRRGLTSQTIPTLDDMFKLVAGKIYLEIDFKSSANYKHVITKIRDYNMTENVILISYNAGQAKKLSKLAPDMMISVSTHKPQDVQNYRKGQAIAWVGKAVTNKDLMSQLRKTDTPIIGTLGKEWDSYRAKAADILVTDYAYNHRPITGLTRQNRDAYKNCLLNYNK